jgi:cell surface protein SprA
LSLNTTRRIYSEELYPLTDIAQGQSQVINTLDLSYYPSERGAYNNDVNFAADPAANFGGIMRSLNSTNFEQGNVDYIQFWVMDPYIGKGQLLKTIQETIFQFREISEDVLKMEENSTKMDLDQIKYWLIQDRFGEMFQPQSLIYAFDTNANNRSNQDVGLDGLSDANEGQCILISRLN